MTPRQRSRIYDRDEGICQVCGGPAEEVDHVVPRSHFGKRRRTERDSDDNLRCICHACHHQRHHGGRVFS